MPTGSGNTMDGDRFFINANKDVYKVKRELHYGQRQFNSVAKNKKPAKETIQVKRCSSKCYQTSWGLNAVWEAAIH